MKVIGLIGGMSWHSTLEYYRLINKSVSEKLSGLHSARVVLYSLEFDEIVQAQHQNRWDDATNILTEAGSALKQAGADFFLICTNTMHKISDAVADGVGLPLLHIADATGDAIAERGLHVVGLLGTRFIMEEQFYCERLRKKSDIQVLVPSEEERAMVHHVIFDELCQGEIKDSSHRACIDIINGLKVQGAEGIVLGCTELPLIIRPSDINIPLFDTTQLHAEAAVKMALAE